MLVKEHLGSALTYQKIAPGNTATGIDDEVYKYVERTLAYTSGGTYVMKAGDTIVGATGGATAVIVSRTTTSGTDGAGTAAGVLTIKCQIGTFQSENLNVEGNSNVATIAADSALRLGDYPYKGMEAKAALVLVETHTQRIAFDGTLPSQTGLFGHALTDGQSFTLIGGDAIRKFRCIDSVGSSVGYCTVSCYF